MCLSQLDTCCLQLLVPKRLRDAEGLRTETAGASPQISSSEENKRRSKSFLLSRLIIKHRNLLVQFVSGCKMFLQTPFESWPLPSWPIFTPLKFLLSKIWTKGWRLGVAAVQQWRLLTDSHLRLRHLEPKRQRIRASAELRPTWQQPSDGHLL